MALVNPQQIDVDGLEIALSAASAGGDEFIPGDDVMLYIVNASAGAITATVVTPGTVQGQPIGDVAIVVDAGERRIAGPFPRQHFAGPDGRADLTWSAPASVTFAVLKL